MIAASTLATLPGLMVRPRPCAPRHSSRPSSPSSWPASLTPATIPAGQAPAVARMISGTHWTSIPSFQRAIVILSARTMQSAVRPRCRASVSRNAQMVHPATPTLPARTPTVLLSPGLQRSVTEAIARCTATKRIRVQMDTCASRTSPVRSLSEVGASW